MSESQPPAIQSAPAPQKTARWVAPIVLILLLVLLVLVLGGGWFAWQQHQIVSLELRHLSSKDAGESKQFDRQIQQINKLVDQNAARSSDNEKLLTQLDRQALFNSKQLNALHGSSRADWLLAEAEYLLRLANQRLNMEKDFAGAESILQAADNVLAENDDPGLYPIRKALASEIASLQTVKRSDIEGIYLKIEALSSLVESLNQRVLLKADALPDEGQAESNGETNSIWSALREDLKNAIRIERLDTPAEPLLAPSQSYYLKQNLRLMLEQAQLAALKNHQALYDQSIIKAEKWVHQYFLLSSQATETVLKELSELREQKVDADIPDISESLRLLKQRIEALYRNHTLSKTPVDESQDS